MRAIHPLNRFVLQRGGHLETASPSSEAGRGLARGLALFLGGFILSGLAASLRAPGFDPNLWWIDLRALPLPVAVLVLSTVWAVLLTFALRPNAGWFRLWFSRWVLGGTLAILTLNAAVVLRLFIAGTVSASFPLPASLLFAAALAYVLRQLGRPETRPGDWRWLCAAALACVGLFPLLQVLCFGRTDYRRPADVAVVFGARVYADGRLSDAVGDRVRTAVELYRAGLVRELVMSGGPGDGAIHETEAMRAAAIRAGVPTESIRLDPAGLSTADTVRNTASQFAGRRVLAVSEFYHLPRIKLAYARAGLDVFTVPAKPQNWRRAWDLRSVFREVPAFWVYYLQATTGQ